TMNMQEIDLDSWPRKHHFEFFREFDEPFFGVIVQIECAPAYHAARTASVSFFSYYLHKILKAANAVENFRYRTDCDRIVIFDRVDASPTLIRADETFGFGYVPYNDSFELFNKDLESEIARVKSTPGLFTRTYPANLL